MKTPALASAKSLIPLIAAACLAGVALAQQPALPPKPASEAALAKSSPPAAAARASLVKVGDLRMQEERFGAAAVADSDYLYIIGGSNRAGTPLDSIERIDFRTGKSEAFGQLRTGRRWLGAVLHERKIYVLGGFSRILPGANPFEPSVEIIDLASRKIVLGAAMPVARAHFGCALVDGKIYAIGGEIQRGTWLINTDTTDVYDITTDKWTPGIPLPKPRRVVAAVADGSIIVLGGYAGNTAQIGIADVAVFDPREKTWRTLPPLCQPVAAHSVALLDHRLYLFGNDAPSKHVVVYDLKDNQSESDPLPFIPVRYSAAAVHDGQIYVVGGYLGGHTVLDDIQVYALAKEH